MELTNEFVIDRNVEETWRILNDLEFIAPCMPGAQLTEIEGDEYRGLVKIKVGPITANYKGKASFIEQDVENKVAKLKAEGRDPRQGNANALVTARMEPVGDDQTNVEIHTDLGLTGKVASFGRGAIEDVSKKILGQFTENLREKLENEPSPGIGSDVGSEVGSEPTADGPDVTDSTDSVDGSGRAAPEMSATSGGVRKIEGPEAEAVDLLAVGGGTMAKRALPLAGAAAVVVGIIYWIIR